MPDKYNGQIQRTKAMEYIKLWNILPAEIKNTETFFNFKKSYKLYIKNKPESY